MLGTAQREMRLDADLANAFFRPFQHRDALRVLTVRCLEQNNAPAAFMFADRLCRIVRGGDQQALILRAEAHLGLSALDAARRDAEAAYEIDPTEPRAARILIRCGSPESRLAAAKLLLQNPRADHASRMAALGALLEDVYTAVVMSREVAAKGIVAWKGEPTVQLDWGGGPDDSSTMLAADAVHDFAGPTWHAADLDWLAGHPRDAREMAALRLRSGRSLLGHLLSLGSTEPLQDTPSTQPAQRTVGLAGRIRTSPAGVTIIVPLFDDVRMTRLCLLALARQQIETPMKVVLVHDNPGHEAMTTLAKDFATRLGFELIENPQNLGFAQSVNRGLANAGDDDVVLLNADVVLPPSALRKLASVAYGAGDIGTVTPLSNNGEEVSFPTPFRSNAIGSYREIQAIDAVAGAVNASREVTLANGIGFCLFVKRSALEAVGRLSTTYGTGYYEDVDYCLRVAQAGFRNICAPNVYVGHKGASSFKGGKRSLVIRNSRVLETRFPSYREESAAFLSADPLSAAREAIELARPPSCSKLLVISKEKLERVARWLTLSERVLHLTWSWREPTHVELRMSDGSSPQSLSFDLSGGDDALLDYLRRAGVSQVRLFGPCLERASLIGPLKAGGALVEMMFEESFLQPRPGNPDPQCAEYDTPHPCDQCAEAFKKTPDGARGLGALLKTIDRVRPTNAMARTIADHFGLGQKVEFSADEPVPTDARKELGSGALGVLYDGQPDIATERLLATLMADLVAPPGFKVIVFGTCLDDLRMMSSGRAFVTGAILDDDLSVLVRHHGIGALFAPYRWFGYGDLERLGMEVPCAYFDWSGGLVQKHIDDLALDPRLCDRKIAHRLTYWLRSLGRADPSHDE